MCRVTPMRERRGSAHRRMLPRPFLPTSWTNVARFAAALVLLSTTGCATSATRPVASAAHLRSGDPEAAGAPVGSGDGVAPRPAQTERQAGSIEDTSKKSASLETAAYSDTDRVTFWADNWQRRTVFGFPTRVANIESHAIRCLLKKTAGGTATIQNSSWLIPASSMTTGTSTSLLNTSRRRRRIF